MNKQVSVSVIVPVYNAENVIRACIESVLNQSFRELELILIDDGSTDNSGVICNEFSKKDNRVITVHQKNTGVSAARNTGINIAKGKYLSFVDSDDEMLPDFLKKGLEDLEAKTADIFIGGYIRTDHLGKSDCTLEHPFASYLSQITENDMVCLFEHNYIAPCWGKIYLKDFIGESKFDTSMKFGEDLKFNIELLTKSPYIIASENTYYEYIAADNSLTTQTDVQKCKNVVETYNILYDYGQHKNYSSKGKYYSYIDKRWQDDLLTLESMILQENSTIFSKYYRIQILCSNKKLISRLSRVQDSYVTGYAIRPLKLVLGRLVRIIKEQTK